MNGPAKKQNLYGPRYWPAWLGVGFLRIVAFLPYPVILVFGRMLGRFYYLLVPERRAIARTNLERCFPDRDSTWYEKTLKAHFASMGMSLLEAPLAWWGGDKRIRRLGEISGLENLEQAEAAGKGVLLFSAHLVCPELSGRIIAQYTDSDAMYRPSNHPVMERVITAQRKRHLGELITRKNVKQLIRRLRAGRVIWYLADQNASRKNGIFVDFFGIPASTTPATSRLAGMTGAAVVPYKALRRAGGKGYKIEILPALTEFPSGDLHQDTQRTNDMIESWIREDPPQYYWIHRRFRTRPNRDDPPFYA